MIPPTATSSSTSGCTAADFNSSFAGKIALVQRGGCNYGVKVLDAQAAGAVGVVIFNEGNPGRTAVTAGSLLDASNAPFVPSIPVAFTSFATGQSLYNEYQAGTPPVMNLSIHVIVDPNREDYNLVAESKGGDPNHVVVVDAHLDAIYGAGMLDNASGSATILDVAQEMPKVKPLNKLRFIWFGGEELGLLGSHYHVDNLSPSELGRIRYDLDADVRATPNYLIGFSIQPRRTCSGGPSARRSRRRCTSRRRSRATRRSRSSTRSARTTSSCPPWAPTRSASTRREFPPAAC